MDTASEVPRWSKGPVVVQGRFYLFGLGFAFFLFLFLEQRLERNMNLCLMRPKHHQTLQSFLELQIRMQPFYEEGVACFTLVPLAAFMHIQRW